MIFDPILIIAGLVFFGIMIWFLSSKLKNEPQSNNKVSSGLQSKIGSKYTTLTSFEQLFSYIDTLEKNNIIQNYVYNPVIWSNMKSDVLELLPNPENTVILDINATIIANIANNMLLELKDEKNEYITDIELFNRSLSLIQENTIKQIFEYCSLPVNIDDIKSINIVENPENIYEKVFVIEFNDKHHADLVRLLY